MPAESHLPIISLKLAHKPSPPDRCDDRQPRLHRRQEARRDREPRASGTEGCLLGWGHHGSSADLGPSRSDSRQAPRHGAVARWIAQGRRAHRGHLASNRKVPQVAFKPDWTKHAKAAPFKRNDQMLDCMPIGVVVFPGTGIQDNLADKARKMGIPVMRFGQRA